MKIQSYLIASAMAYLCGIGSEPSTLQLPIALEAEQATLIGKGPVINTHENGKYVENITFGSSLEYTDVELGKAGVYRFDINYLTGDTNRPLAITVNGYDPVIAYFTETTASWGNPADTKTATAYLHFNAGKNSIKITPLKPYGPNIDKFIIQKSDKPIEENVYPYDLTDEARIEASDHTITLKNLTDNNYNTIYTVTGKSSTTIVIDCQHPILATGYLLSAGKGSVQDVSTWKLEASTDNKMWREVVTQSIIKNEYSSTFHVTPDISHAQTEAARYYRLTAKGEKEVRIAELQLFGIPFTETGEAFMPDIMSEVSTSDHTSAIPQGEDGTTYLHLFDRNLSTKYYGASSESFIVTAEPAQTKRLSSYTLTSCADAIDRDPKSWDVEGYNGYAWEVIDQVHDFLFPCRLATMKFKVSTAKSYQAFRLRMRATSGSTNFQLSQWQLFGENAPMESIPQTAWAKKASPITTPWYDSIDPNNVLGEYPRPQMVRDNWMNLNGIWDFKESVGMGRYRANQSFDKKVLVPFPIESALSGLMMTDHDERPYKAYLYNRKFTVPAAIKGERTLLHFGAVDWRCEVYVNGQAVGMHEGGYDPFYFDITTALKEVGEQELQVQFMDPTDAGGQPIGKQKIRCGGIFYTPSSGIWQTVWIERVNESYIRNFTITPDVDKNRVGFKALGINGSNCQLTIRIYDQGKKVAETESKFNQTIYLPIAQAKLWSPESPFLYDVELELKRDNKVLDKVKSYFGMRKISVGQVNGKACFMLNNEPIFQYGPLDQGFWPEGLYTAPSDEALLFDVEQTKALGFNMTRKHIKTEPARWYYHCDRLGLLVWQDMVNAGSDQNILGDDAWVRKNFLRESTNIVNSLINHPSIVTWVAFNEGFGQYGDNDSHTRNACNTLHKLDPSRIINSASGWIIFNLGEVADMHSYPRPGMLPNPTPNRVSVCGEYGGITYVIKDHVWKNSDMVYVSVNSGKELKDLFSSYTDLLKPLQSDGLGAAVYTQLTDLEGEVNGLITYDRKVVKVTIEQKVEIKKAIEKAITASAKELIPTALRAKGVEWKYTTNTPTENWNTIAFNDASWATGISGFGDGNAPNTSYDNKSTVHTAWRTSNIYLRKTFRVEKEDKELGGNLRLTLYHDDDCEVYINGVLAFTSTGYISNYNTVTVTPEAQEAMRVGDNSIAIKCKQYSGGQYIDAGLILEYSVDSPSTGTTTLQTPNNTFYLYPNPTDGYCCIKSDKPEAIRAIKIFDLAGKQQKVASSSSFYVNDLLKGTYIVQVCTEETNHSLKLIKE